MSLEIAATIPFEAPVTTVNFSFVAISQGQHGCNRIYMRAEKDSSTDVAGYKLLNFFDGCVCD